MPPKKLVRVTTVPLSMRVLLTGQPAYMKAGGFDVHLVSSAGKDWEGIPRLEEYGVHQVHMSRPIDLPRDFLALVSLVRLFRKLRPDIVHSHTPKAGLLSMMAARITGVPVRIHTVAGLPLMEARGLKRRVLVAMERLTYACATGVYPNSFRLRDFIADLGIVRAAKLRVIAQGSSNGIDTDYFRATPALREAGAKIRESLGISPGAMVFLFVGRIVKDKGITELVDAFQGLSANDDDAHLLLVGPFEDDQDPVVSRTREAIEKLPGIHPLGFQLDIRPYLAASDVLAFPSYREGFPNVVLQAGCFDLPAIVTDINGSNEIIHDGVNGLIVPVKDADALRAAMVKMSSDKAFRDACADRARAEIVDKYRREAVWEALYREYRRLLPVDPLE